MKTTLPGCGIALALLLAVCTGCSDDRYREDVTATQSKATPRPSATPPGAATAPQDDGPPPGEPVSGPEAPVGTEAAPSTNVFLEVVDGRRRVLVNAYVCLREGMLEQLLTKKRMKEHEAILAADVDARDIHTALLFAGAVPGSPVKFQPKFAPPSGTPIKITLEYPLRLIPDPKNKGKFLRVLPKKETTRVNARRWVRSVKTKKDLETDWVFAGSILSPDPLDPKRPPYYRANEGDVICVSNFDTALLDVPFNSSKDNDDLSFEANTARIPPLQTSVVVVLQPVLPKKNQPTK